MGSARRTACSSAMAAVAILLAGPAWADGPRANACAEVHPGVAAQLAATPHGANIWVYFRDKGLTDPALQDAIDAVAASYPRAALHRRQVRRTAPDLFDERDVAVSPLYVSEAAATGAALRTSSHWLNAVSLTADAQQVARIAALPFVERIEPVRRGRRLEPVAVRPLRADAAGDASRGLPPPYHGLADAQLSQINVTAMHSLGFTGHGVRIAVLDTGFRRSHSAFNGPEFPLQVLAEWDFINGDSDTGPQAGDPDGQPDHGTYILGTLAAHAPGAFVGAAYRASYILCKTEDISAEYQAEEDYYVAALAFAEFHGADVITSSLSYYDWYTQDDFDGLTAVTTIGVNIATANGVVCLTAAGNRGHDADPLTSTISAPADALQVIACGAVQGSGATSWFSSDGPSADGRVKPEVLARGSQTATVSATDPAGYIEASGTSLSTPLVAGAVACLLQARPAWTVDQARVALYTSADGYAAAGASDPLFIRGYGVIDALAARLPDCNRNGVNDDAELAAGVVPDCNGNGIPDSCDIAIGISRDADADGVPDECHTCTADWNGDEVINSTDISAFITAWLSSVGGGTLEADVDGNGVVNSSDISAFLTLWLTAVVGGC